MSNVLEFYIKMKDMMSGGLVKIAKTAKEGFAQVQTAVNKVQQNIANTAKKNDILGSSFDALKTKAKQLEAAISSSNSVAHIRAARRELDLLNSQMSRHAGNTDRSSKSGILGSIGLGGLMSRFAPAALLAGGLALSSSSVNAAMQFGATKQSYQVLAGDAGKGRALANDLNKLQQDTILGSEVFKAGQTLMGFGINADKVVGIVKELGDVAMGDSQRFESLTLAFAQTQAAGKLMGQDLLQYINAGFNPLQTMSEKWEQFGFKQKQTVGQLKDLMEKGAISSNMVAKAFDIATSSGGKFANMMETIGQTSYGKMKQMEGQWEGFKISLGNALMPLAQSFMETGSSVLTFLNLNKSIPDTLISEHLEMNTLVNTLSQYNMGSDMRNNLLGQLIAKYPDFFGNLDKENSSTKDLLDTLNKVNEAYTKKIGLAQSQLAMDINQKKYIDEQQEWIRTQTIADAERSGNRDYAKTLKKWYEGWLTDGFDVANYYQRIADDHKNKMVAFKGKFDEAQNLNKTQIAAKDLEDINEFVKNNVKINSVFGTNNSAKQLFIDEVKKVNEQASSKAYSGFLGTQYWAGGTYDYEAIGKLKKQMLPSRITSTNTKGTDNINIESEKVGKSVVSSGSRNIYISGVKFTDKIELHVSNIKEGIENLEAELENMFLRVLNSGATVSNS